MRADGRLGTRSDGKAWHEVSEFLDPRPSPAQRSPRAGSFLARWEWYADLEELRRAATVSTARPLTPLELKRVGRVVSEKIEARERWRADQQRAKAVVAYWREHYEARAREKQNAAA